MNGMTFFGSVASFCRKHGIHMPNMSDRYMEGTRRSCQQKNNITIEYYYHFNIFNVATDFQLVELDSRFKKETMELLVLSEASNPMNGFKSFKIDSIYTLAEKFYSKDFTEDELKALKRQLEHYKFDVLGQP
ncbi:hypothetical protein Ddye_028308 [Dipteronia dyeriana]|uniref:Uncharacterized protein n=1 Tax=Dipteronia dyeriana TaxID=168575 RepID=A0AAD9TR93_9ROSI|nr:hypothetical protein Ddye_028308 [Dipteronia dyeriana]